MRFDGSTVVVTGSGSGIGRATAVAIAELGGRVVLGDINLPAAEEAAAALRAAGHQAAPTASTSRC